MAGLAIVVTASARRQVDRWQGFAGNSPERTVRRLSSPPARLDTAPLFEGAAPSRRTGVHHRQRNRARDRGDLVFAINVDVAWVDLDMVGYILMGAGVVIFLLGIVLAGASSSDETVSRTVVDPATGAPTTRRSVSSTGDDAV